VKGIDGRFVTADVDTLLVALYVFVDDHVVSASRRRLGRPKRLSDGRLAASFSAAAVVTAKRPVLHGDVIWRYRAS
jgi:hypothetical protein